MSKGVNKCILIGNLGQDPEVRYMPNGDAVANFTVATSESWNDRNTGEKQERTEWHRIVAFKKLGEICGKYLSKGSKVYIEGSIKTRKWQDQQGQDRYTTEIVARDMQMLDSRGEGRQQGQQQRPQQQQQSYAGPPGTQQQQPQQQPQQQMPSQDYDPDIPF